MTPNNLQPKSDTALLDVSTVLFIILATGSALLSLLAPPLAVVAILFVMLAVTTALISWRRGRATNKTGHQL